MRAPRGLEVTSISVFGGYDFLMRARHGSRGNASAQSIWVEGGGRGARAVSYRVKSQRLVLVFGHWGGKQSQSSLTQKRALVLNYKTSGIARNSLGQNHFSQQREATARAPTASEAPAWSGESTPRAWDARSLPPSDGLDRQWSRLRQSFGRI